MRKIRSVQYNSQRVAILQSWKNIRNSRSSQWKSTWNVANREHPVFPISQSSPWKDRKVSLWKKIYRPRYHNLRDGKTLSKRYTPSIISNIHNLYRRKIRKIQYRSHSCHAKCKRTRATPFRSTTFSVGRNSNSRWFYAYVTNSIKWFSTLLNKETML